MDSLSPIPFRRLAWVVGLSLALIALLAVFTAGATGRTGAFPIPDEGAPAVPDRPQDVITIPQDSNAVTMDGVCDVGTEYSKALAFQFDEETISGTVYLKQDAMNLFVCMEGVLGTKAERFASVYLDADNGREKWAEGDDYSLRVDIITGTESSWVGTGVSNGYTSTVLDDWTAVVNHGDHDVAEYKIPITLTGGICNVPFGMAVYHHWVEYTGNDYGWPSNQYFDQPQTWQTVQFSAAPCPSADLSLTKYDDPDPVTGGGLLTYTLVVDNGAGPDTAFAIKLTDTLPAEVTYIPDMSDERCTEAYGTVTCDLGDLDQGWNTTVYIVVIPPSSGGTITNTAIVTAKSADGKLGNNTDSIPTTVNPAPIWADLAVTKSDTPDPVLARTPLTYTIVVNNYGSFDAPNVIVTDTLPQDVMPIAYPYYCYTTEQNIICALGELASKADATVTIVVSVKSAGSIVNTVTVGSDIFDPNTENNTATASTTVVESSQGGVNLFDVPIQFHYMAAQLLEEMRNSPLAPGWGSDAHLSDIAYPLYRPDVEGVAYYDFPVLPGGFIIVSTGAHDFPIPHWNYEGLSPSQEMTGQALAARKVQTTDGLTFYKLDALSYAAESGGAQVASVGTPLLKVTGMDPAWLSQPVTLTQSTWMPDQPTADDTVTTTGHLTTTGPVSSSIQLEAWASWSELKDNYSSSYGVLLQALRDQASRDWQIESALSQHGVGLRRGEEYTLALLWMTPTLSISGVGVQYVQTDTVTRPGLPPALWIHVQNTLPAGLEAPFTVTVGYSTSQKTVRFMVIEPAAMIFLPYVSRNVGGQLAQSTQSPQAIQGDWGPWHIYWAGTHEDQRLYNQINPYDPPNTSSCSSGCGATAWGMLFGWADHQAALNNPYWAPRNGIYRQNGGYGADADAPRDMDAGVRNMIWEIRNRIGTWCAGSSGPTFPWNMANAAGYLSGRSGTRVDTHYNVLGISESRLRDYAVRSIYRRTPAIIGTGWLNHYPLAYGYAWCSRTVNFLFWDYTDYAHKFYVNQGWGGAHNGWVSASTWFAGEIYP